MTKDSTRFVNRVEMLNVGRLRNEPTFGCALRALHHLHEAGSHFRFTIASAIGCTKPGFRRACVFHITGVHLPHAFYCFSVNVKIQFCIRFDRHVAYLPVKMLHCRGLMTSSAGFHTSPQYCFSDFCRLLRADVSELLEDGRDPMLDQLRCCCNWWWNQWLGWGDIGHVEP